MARSADSSPRMMTPQMMVLGLVVQEPDTVAGVGRRLAEQFASARFPRSSAYTNLPVLAEQGYVRLVEERDEPAFNRYEATPAGVDRLRRWLRSSNLTPVIRDALQGKLEFLELEDLAALVRVVREEETAHAAACRIAHGRLLQEQHVRRRARSRGKPGDWRTKLRLIQSKDEVTLWHAMSDRLEQLGDELEQLLADGSV